MPGAVRGGEHAAVGPRLRVGRARGTAAYSATKAGLTHFTSGLRLELHGLPVGLTSVEMGVVRTDMGEAVEDHPPFAAAYRRYRRLGMIRYHDADEIARAVVKAVRSGKRYVRLPRRSRMFPAVSGTPRRMNELILTGVPRRAAGGDDGSGGGAPVRSEMHERSGAGVG